MVPLTNKEYYKRKYKAELVKQYIEFCRIRFGFTNYYYLYRLLYNNKQTEFTYELSERKYLSEYDDYIRNLPYRYFNIYKLLKKDDKNDSK